VTQVLGTAFLVRHYQSDARVHVAVAEGKVNVKSVKLGRPLSSPLILTAGHVSDITDSTIAVNAVNDLTPETDWLRGQLVFRHASVSEVFQTLSRWYGYQFRCSDSTLVRKNVTIALDAHSSAEALALLGQLLSAHLTVVGDTVTLTPHPYGTTKGNVRKQASDVWLPTRGVGR
jgi:ferric-dicitrate binding protein FerR (iron transport regulator)